MLPLLSKQSTVQSNSCSKYIAGAHPDFKLHSSRSLGICKPLQDFLRGLKEWWDCRNFHLRIGHDPGLIIHIISSQHTDMSRMCLSAEGTCSSGECAPVMVGPKLQGSVSQQ
jgi:hypothetical protein